MNLYSLVTSLHVVVAILGVGPLMALAVMTRPCGESFRAQEAGSALRGLLPLLRLSQVSLALMLTTGAILIAIVHGAYGGQLWMMISAVLFLALGTGTVLVQRNLKRALAATESTLHLERAHRLLLAMCGVVVVIAWLMEAKPF